MIKISKTEAFQGMNETDSKVYDYETYLIQQWAIDNERKVTSQFYLDLDNTILLNFYDENRDIVGSVRFNNKSALTDQGKKAIGIELHKYLRGIRIEHGELLKDMADRLGMRSSELSAIENGKKPVPDDFLGRIKISYKILK